MSKCTNLILARQTRGGTWAVFIPATMLPIGVELSLMCSSAKIIRGGALLNWLAMLACQKDVRVNRNFNYKFNILGGHA